RLIPNMALFAAGLALVVIMRPHMGAIYVAAFACAVGLLLVIALLCKGSGGWGFSLKPVLMIGVGLVVISFAPVVESLTVDTGDWEWKSTSYLPTSIDGLFKKLAGIRAHFVHYGLTVEAGSIIDAAKTPETVAEVMGYLPRALHVGL